LNGEIGGEENLSLPVHPTQVYDSLAALGLFVLLMAARRHTVPDGRLSLGFAAAYALSRFGIEFYRGDASRGFAGVLSLPQVFSLLAFIAAGFLLFSKLRKGGLVSAVS
jgi:phosphatidylglycerol:prolipoprotein diacylglycerol transferase